ncbi:MAG TPA: response regulator transcription factor [Thermodesulfobacteriota bacterium]|nr:response regulator transcription factor [Thermodesulfobacteriota bacterium]
MAGGLILIVEDEKDISNLISHNLKKAGFRVIPALNGTAALSKAKESLPDLILLDLLLPDLEGTEVYKLLKQNPKTKGIPVIMVTAKGEEVDRIVGLELGADDYITKPFSVRELVLRVKAVLKRTRGEKEEKKEIIKAGDITIDKQGYKAWVGKEEVSLTATEFKLLLELMENPGKVMTRDTLLNNVWGYSYEGYARTVDTHIRRLREKLGKAGDSIETVRGIGYCFRES